jgi:hypothetical protein
MTAVDLGQIGYEAAGTTTHRYPNAAMIGDYLRALAGLVPTGVLLVIFPLGGIAIAVLGSLAAIFGIFGARTALRHGTRFEVDDAELRAIGICRRAIVWAELDRMKLAYYSTRRDRKAGWMQLELGAPGTRVSVDSRIDGFDHLVRRAAFVAGTRGLDLSDATVANLQALGVRLPETGAER